MKKDIFLGLFSHEKRRKYQFMITVTETKMYGRKYFNFYSKEKNRFHQNSSFQKY